MKRRSYSVPLVGRMTFLKKLGGEVHLLSAPHEVSLEAAAKRYISIFTTGLVPVNCDTVGHVDQVPVRIQLVHGEWFGHEIIDIFTIVVAGERPELQSNHPGEQPPRFVLVVETGADGPLAAAQIIGGCGRELCGKTPGKMMLAVMFAFFRKPERSQQIIDAGVDIKTGRRIARGLPGMGRG